MRLSMAATVLAFLAIPTIASAHAGNNDPNVVHACIGNVSKIVRIVGVSGSCISSPPVQAETPAHWDIRGPQGAPGTNGIDGTSVTFEGYFSGNQNGCPNGGAVYAAGNPPLYAYVCNGADGRDGQDGATGATRPDPPCFDEFNRYVDCGNGTVTDTVTGLIWLKDAACLLGVMRWIEANQFAAGLKGGDCGGNLTDKSSPGDWRLPTKDEWSATIASDARHRGDDVLLSRPRTLGERECAAHVGPFRRPEDQFSSSRILAARDHDAAWSHREAGLWRPLLRVGGHAGGVEGDTRSSWGKDHLRSWQA